MTWESTLLWGALASTLAGLGWDLLGPSTLRTRAVARLHSTAALLLGMALGLLTFHFLASNLHIEYVFTYSRVDYPWYYKLAGLWAGQKGTLLMWATFTAVFGWAFVRKGERAVRSGALPPDAADSIASIRRWILVLVALLVGATLVARTFHSTPDYLLQFRPRGNGLQPVLLTPFMVIHPPLQFLGYALTGILFAGALAHWATGAPHWAALVRPWARLCWLILTIGLGLGGLWAYYVLNFGGFWAWDPVETANLIAWFPVTLFLHALLRYREGRFQSAAPAFAALTWPLALFATVATRTGLWVSVHAFTDPSKNFARDPFVRLLNILETGPLLRYLTALLFASLLLAAVALAQGRLRRLPGPTRALAEAGLALGATFVGFLLFVEPVGSLSALFQVAYATTLGRSAALGLLLLVFAASAFLLLTGPEPHRSPEPRVSAKELWKLWVTEPRLLALGILLLSLALLVTFLIDLLSINGYDRLRYDARAPLVALPIFATLSTLFLLPRWGPKGALAAAVGASAVGILLALLVSAHWQVLLVLPCLLLTLAASADRALTVSASGGRASPRDRHVSLALGAGALIGFLYWGNPPTHIALGGLEVHPHWTWAFPAYALSTFALMAALVHRGSPHPTLARAASLLLVPTIGFGLSTALGLWAFWLLRNSPSSESSARQAIGSRRPTLRKTTLYLIHVALVMGLVGFALATYESTESDPLRANAAGSPSFQGYSLRVLDGSGVGWDAEQGLPEEVHARVLLFKDGKSLEEATLVYWLVHDETPGHYDARVTVVRRALQDLYLFPVELVTPSGVLTDHVNDARPTNANVTEVQVTVKILPAMRLVWTGLWLLGLFMAANLALGGFEIGSPRRETLAPAPQPR